MSAEAQRRYYASKPERIAARHAAHKAKLAAIKLERGCMDCGYNEHPEALDFDHRPDEIKLFGITSASHRRPEAVDAEIAKCDVVCANCHRIRTAERRVA